MNKDKLQFLYIDKKLSAAEIARKFNCSSNKINYWIKKFGIQKRSISEAVYQKNNPSGDPFNFSIPRNYKKMFLFGLGLGLFWGEGSKKNIHSVRLSNGDPNVIKKFIEFLITIYSIDKNRLRFQLQTYDDLNLSHTLAFWVKYLGVKNTQFYKSTILEKRGTGTYHERMKFGVIIIYFNNMKLRNLIFSQIANMSNL